MLVSSVLIVLGIAAMLAVIWIAAPSPIVLTTSPAAGPVTLTQSRAQYTSADAVMVLGSSALPVAEIAAFV